MSRALSTPARPLPARSCATIALKLANLDESDRERILLYSGVEATRTGEIRALVCRVDHLFL